MAVKKQWLIPATVVLIVASVTFATIMAANPAHAMFSFYQLPTRMGELLIGALLALTLRYLPDSKTLKNLASIMGTGLVVGSFLLINSKTIFPGVHALWPCLGAAAIIYSGHNSHGPLQKLLALRFMLLIGAMSYSLYLWHWPTLSFARYYTMSSNLNWQVLTFCAVVTFLMSYIAWRWVEEPFRYSKLSFKQTLIRYLLILGVLVLVVGLVVKDDHFMGNSTLSQERKFLNQIACVNKIRSTCNVIGASTQKPELLVFGDSHTRHFAYVFQAFGLKNNVGVDLISSNGCEFLLDPKANDIGNCKRLYQHIEKHIADYPQLLIAHSWDRYFNGDDGLAYQKNLDAALRQAAKRNQKVFLLEQVPNYQKNVMRAHHFGHDNKRIDSYQKANIILADIAKAYDNVQIISVNEFATQWKNGSLNNQAFYFDSNHLTLSAQKQLVKDLLSHPDNALAKLLLQLKTKSGENQEADNSAGP